MKTVNGGIETFYESVTRTVLSPGSLEDRYPKTFTLLIIGIMILFMVLPAVNLININISRIQERISEIGIRKSFGATSSTLVFQFITENVILTLIGGLLGFLCSVFILEMITDSGVIRYAQFAFDPAVFLYGFLVTLFFALFSGVYPAWKMSRIHPVYALRGEHA